jgi:hypothetical protein
MIRTPMPTLPLLTDPANPNGSHRVLAPGGYEAWHFDASSDDGKLHVIAALHEAWGLDPAYLRKYAWYRRFPTRVTPPNPLEFPAVTFVLCEEGRQTVRFNARMRAGRSAEDVRISGDDGRGVRIGASHAERSGDGSMRLHLRGTDRLRTIAANLTFRPTLPRAGRELTLVDSPAVGLHRWVIIDPLCEVEGEISIFEPSGGGTPRTISFAGNGTHHHRYGTRPLAAANWFGGRVLLDERAFAFEQVSGLREGRHDEAVVVSAGVEATDVQRDARVSHEGDDVRIGFIHLARPRVLESKGCETLLSYDARVGGESGVALCRRIQRRRWIPAG